MELIEFNRLKFNFNHVFKEYSLRLLNMEPFGGTKGPVIQFKMGRRLKAHRKNNLFYITVNLMKSGNYDHVIIFRLNGNSRVSCLKPIAETQGFTINFRKRKKLRPFYFTDVDFVAHSRSGNIYQLFNNLLKTEFGTEWFAFKAGDVNVSLKTFLRKMKVVQDKYVYEFLLDQTIFYGLGEYLVSEIIHDFGFPLKTKISSLDTGKLKKLYQCICFILLTNYRLDGIGYDIMGEDCEYQHKLKVYKKSDQVFRYKHYNIYHFLN